MSNKCWTRMTNNEALLRALSIAVIFVCSSHLSCQACDSNREFECPTTRWCIPNHLTCNYYDDCRDGSDEEPAMCRRPPADMNTALVLTLSDKAKTRSFLLKLFGNPSDYVPEMWKMGNYSYARRLPIYFKEEWYVTYDFFRSVTVDYGEHRVYWSNNAYGLIQYGRKVYHNSTTHYFKSAVPPTKKINGITFDWVSGNTYWIVDELKMIDVSNKKRRWKPLIETGLVSPQDLVVDPSAGYLFWTDAGIGRPTIERSNLTGGNRKVLLTVSDGLVLPKKLVADVAAQKLYWLDSAANSVGSANYDGTEAKVTTRDEFGNFSTMAIQENFLFFGDAQETMIHVYDKSSFVLLSSGRLVTVSDGPVVDMVMFSQETQPNITSACAMDNGGCSQFCYTTSSTSRVCQCSAGFVLDDDGATCVVRPVYGSFLLIADSYQYCVYQLKPDTGEIRALWTTYKIHPIAVAFDQKSNVVYAISEDQTTNQTFTRGIRRTSLDQKIDEFIYNASKDAGLAGIDVDSERGLLYFADRHNGIITEMSTDGSQNRDVVNNHDLSPTGVVVDSENRKIYWTDCCIRAKNDRKNGKYCTTPGTIQVVSVDGGSPKMLITDKLHQCIVALAVDFDRKTMYWASVSNAGNSVIEKANVDGTGRTVLLAEQETSFTGLALVSDSVYVLDAEKRHILKYDIASGKVSVQPPSLFSKLQDVKFVAQSVEPSRQLRSSDTDSDDHKYLIIAIVVGCGGGLLIVLLIAVMVCCCLRMKKKRSSGIIEEDFNNGHGLEVVSVPYTAADNDGFHLAANNDEFQPKYNEYEHAPPPPPATTTYKSSTADYLPRVEVVEENPYADIFSEKDEKY